MINEEFLNGASTTFCLTAPYIVTERFIELSDIASLSYLGVCHSGSGRGHPISCQDLGGHTVPWDWGGEGVEDGQTDWPRQRPVRHVRTSISRCREVDQQKSAVSTIHSGRGDTHKHTLLSAITASGVGNHCQWCRHTFCQSLNNKTEN